MKLLTDILRATFLAMLIAIAAGAAWWGYREAPLVHSALWNFSSSSYDIKQNSGRELLETNKVLAGTKDLIEHTDNALNGTREHPGAIPQITALVKKAQPAMDNLVQTTADLDTAVKHTDQAIQQLNTLFAGGTATIGELQAAIHQVNDVIGDLDQVVGHLDDKVTDPTLKNIVANFDKTAQNAATSMEQLAAIATDGRQVADKARETYLKPVNLWWGLVKTLLPLAGSAAQVVK